MLYLTLFFLLMLTCLYGRHRFTILDGLIFFLFVLVAGFRYNVGTDYQSYVSYYKRVNLTGDSPAEIGFDSLAAILNFLGFNNQAIFLSISILTLFFFYKGLKYYSQVILIYKPVFYIMFFIFVYIDSFNAMRQILACSIIFYATKFMFEKSFIRYIFWVIIATLFHFSSIIFVIFYFIINKSYSKITMFAGLALTFLLSINNLFTEVMNFIAYDFTFLDLGGYANNYIDSSYNTENNVSYGIVFFISLLLLMVIILKKQLFKNNVYLRVLLNFYYLYIISLIAAGDAYVFARFQYHLGIYMALIISTIPLLFENETKKIVKVGMLIMYSLLFLYIIMSGIINPAESEIFPYEFRVNIF